VVIIIINLKTQLMKIFQFVTNKQISILDVLTMGDSEKAEDATKIGQYASGLKYAIALLLRNNIQIKIKSGDYHTDKHHEFTFSTKKLEDKEVGKQKEVIIIHDYDHNTEEETTHVTSFSVKLGLDWQLGYAFRELASNMIDEGGYWADQEEEVRGETYTVIQLLWKDNPEWDTIIENRNDWVLTPKALIQEISSDIQICNNPDGHVKLYKQGILIYEDKEKPSKYIYNTTFGDINEMRVLKDVYKHMSRIFETIMTLKNVQMLQHFVFDNACIAENDILNSINGYQNCNDSLLGFASNIYQTHGNYFTFDPIRKAINSRKDCTMPGRAITSVGDHIWAHYNTVTIENEPISLDKGELTVQEQIEKLYNMKVECEIKLAELSSSTIIADKYNKCLLITSEFDPELHFVDFLIQYIDLTQKGNIITNLAKYIQDLIRK